VRRAQVDETVPGAAVPCADPRWPLPLARRWRLVLLEDTAAAAAGLARWRAASDLETPSALIERLEHLLDASVLTQRATTEQLDQWLAEAATHWRALPDELMGDGSPQGEDVDPDAEPGTGGEADGQAPAVRLLDATLHDALRDGASDIHFECNANGAVLRMRLDGVMQPVSAIASPALAAQLVSRLKVLAELDIGERRLPQDGRFQARVAGRRVDFRLSVMPSVHGEDAVIRVLDRSPTAEGAGATRPGQAPALSLAALGFAPDLAERLRRLALRPQGMLLATGPTGSGKTTTLYALIAESFDGRDKVVTIEDPVEVGLAGIVQVPVNERQGLSFARGLRSLLRHDPDRVLVGEIRDAETAQIAVQAALTGHGVLSSVHANGALEVLARFMHLGLDLYNLASALNAVLAQRLVRVLCPHCAVPALPTTTGAQAATPRLAVGCVHCRHTGYLGRRTIAELLVLDDPLRDAIADRAPKARLRELALATGWRPLRDAARDAVQRGLTSQAEIERVLGDVD
jgi:general secretion pathway protein E